jgi:S1-C subfamily serine protease
VLLLEYAILKLRAWKNKALKIKLQIAALFRTKSKPNQKSKLTIFFNLCLILMLLSAQTMFIFKSDDIHRSYLRKYVGSRVYKVMIPNSGGGTGFAIKAPSGRSYILTNDHICALARHSSIYLKDGLFSISTKIISRSDKTDLCLLTAPTNEIGLDLANYTPMLGDQVFAIGHPGLDLLTLSNKGEIISISSTKLTERAIRVPLNTTEDGECDTDNPKFHIETIEGDDYCVVDVPSVYNTSVLIKQGSSGSPLVDFYGDVVGVVAGMDSYTWGVAVTLKDVKEFLADK